MKSIELTEEHKAKILEMCSKLFPEYNSVQLTDNSSRFHKYQNSNERIFITFFGELGGIAVRMHWFEFCIKYIIPKLKGKPLWSNSIAEDFVLHAEDPVQYLYLTFHRR